MSDKVLIIEDEPTLARLVTYNLSQEGYETEVVGNGTEGLHRAMHEPYDVILLDLMLPGLNGFEVLQKLRSHGVKTPVIILTARDTEEEVVQGLKLGADDYITKPFGVAELLARTAAVLRRSRNEEGEPAQKSAEGKSIVIGDLQIFPEKYEVLASGQWVSLRPKEFEVLMYLAERPGIVVTRDDLMNIVWGFDYIGGQRTVDVHMSSLRKKLELNQQSVQIESIRGVGYKLIVNRKAAAPE